MQTPPRSPFHQGISHMIANFKPQALQLDDPGPILGLSTGVPAIDQRVRAAHGPHRLGRAQATVTQEGVHVSDGGNGGAIGIIKNGECEIFAVWPRCLQISSRSRSRSLVIGPRCCYTGRCHEGPLWYGGLQRHLSRVPLQAWSLCLASAGAREASAAPLIQDNKKAQAPHPPMRLGPGRLCLQKPRGHLCARLTSTAHLKPATPSGGQSTWGVTKPLLP